jgi:SAM-dependent methyltransferase
MNFKLDLICPCCRSPLKNLENNYLCTDIVCEEIYPIVDFIPVLINEKNSLFNKSDFTKKRDTFFKSNNLNKDILKKFVPKISLNVNSKRNFIFLGKTLSKLKSPKVLVIGGSIDGDGFSELRKFKKIEFIESDISFGKNTKIIFDCHNIPFKNSQFDAVIVQAVLEHVLEPSECVSEIHRVLKKDSLVYSEIPFMQQVHGGKFDFTRFTHLGHINLFKNFNVIRSGPTCGPGMALSWSYLHFLLSFSYNTLYRSFIFVFASFTSFFLKYLDFFLVKKRSSYGASSGTFLIAKKSNKTLSGKEVLKYYNYK